MLPVEVAQQHSGQVLWPAVAVVRTLAVPVVVAEHNSWAAVQPVALELAQVRARVRLLDLEQ